MPDVNFVITGSVHPIPAPDQIDQLQQDLYHSLNGAFEKILTAKSEHALMDFEILGGSEVKISVSEEGEESTCRAELSSWGWGPMIGSECQCEEDNVETAAETGDFQLSGVSVFIDVDEDDLEGAHRDFEFQQGARPWDR